MAATTEGLRERKKRQTREAIAQAAMALFVARGFDAVTVADVARAADVSEKTVFNYFPAKEDLVFARAARSAGPRSSRRSATRPAGDLDRRAASARRRWSSSTASSTTRSTSIVGRPAARGAAAARCATGCSWAGSRRRRRSRR